MADVVGNLSSPYPLALGASAVLCAALAAYAMRRRDVAAASWLAAMMGAGAMWLLADLLEVTSRETDAKLFWARAAYLGIVSVPPIWLFFAASYAGEGPRLTRRALRWLLPIPAASLALTWTGAWHGLMWFPSETGRAGHGPLSLERGPWFWVHTAYSYLLLVAGAALLLRIFLRPFAQHRLQTAALVGGLLAPWGLNVVHLVSPSTFAGIDLTPFAVGLSGSVAAVSLFYFRTQDLLPAARARIVESLNDGILVLDASQRVIQANPAARRLIAASSAELRARSLPDLLGLPAGDLTSPLSATERLELTVERSGDRRDLELSSGPLHAPGERTAGYVVVLRDVTERKRLERELEHLAFHDPLTGLPNRSRFERELGAALAEGPAQGSLAVAFFHLDKFKVVNDSLGHEAGDAALRAVSERVTEALDDSARVARWSGGEFAVLMRDLARPEDAMALTERVCRSFREPIRVGLRRFFLGARGGVAVYSGQRDGGELLRDAGIALYHARSGGEPRGVQFEPAMVRQALDRIELENELRSALDRRALELVFQPIVVTDSGRIRGLEALSRWTAPGRGPVPPSVFVPIAEETDLIVELGRWALDAACAELARWRAAEEGGDAALAVSVNVSTRQFAAGTLVADVQRALAEYELAPERLWLEITETDLMRDVAASASQLESLRDLGVRVAVDDFGTGHSALGYLKDLPLDSLKIDRSFVSGLGKGTADDVLLERIVDLAHALSLGVTAEGVETSQQLDVLRRISCDLAQGYWFSRPVSADRVEGWLRSETSLPAAG